MRSFVLIFVTVFAVSAAEITGIQVDTSAAEISACNNAQCNQACIAVHWEGGYCKDGQCWCWKHKGARRVEKQMTEIQPATGGMTPWGSFIQAAEISTCDNDQCNRNCIAIHWEGGYCKDGMCWCWKHNGARRVEKQMTAIQPATGVAASSLCISESCVSDCTVRNYSGGACQSGECMCWKERPERRSWQAINDLATNYKDKTGSDVASCTDGVRCLEACQHHGAVGGFCLKSVCWCSMSYDRKADRRVKPVIELQGNITSNDLDGEAASCASTDCNVRCRSLNGRSGVCLYGYCWCQDDKKPKQERLWTRLTSIPQ